MNQKRPTNCEPRKMYSKINGKFRFKYRWKWKMQNVIVNRFMSFRCSFIHHLPFPSSYHSWFAIWCMIWMAYGIWKIPKIQASHYIYTFIYLLNHIIRQFGIQIANGKNMNCEELLKDLEPWITFYAKNKIKCVNIVPYSRLENHRHINSATTHNIFNNFFSFTSSKSNFCTVQIVGLFVGNNSDKVTSRIERSTKSATTLCKCLLLNIVYEQQIGTNTSVLFSCIRFDA